MLLGAGSNEVLKSKLQVILEIVVTKFHAHNILFPSKDNYFACVEDRDELPVFVCALGLVVTEENDHEWKNH